MGFAGLRPAGDALVIEPVIAPGWEALELSVRFRGSRVRLRIDADTVEVSADPQVSAISPTGERVVLTPNVQSFELPQPIPRRPLVTAVLLA